MPTVTAFSFTNVTPPATPPDYFAGINAQGHGTLGPNASAAVPPGKTSITLRWDQTNIPANQTFAFSVDLHTNTSGWQEVSNFSASGGQLPADSGGGFVATDVTGILSGEYPDLCRIHIKSYGGWLLPILAIEFD